MSVLDIARRSALKGADFEELEPIIKFTVGEDVYRFIFFQGRLKQIYFDRDFYGVSEMKVDNNGFYRNLNIIDGGMYTLLWENRNNITSIDMSNVTNIFAITFTTPVRIQDVVNIRLLEIVTLREYRLERMSSILRSARGQRDD